MRFTALLPSYAEEPVGGFRVAYEYASWMAREGHRVTLLHPGAMERPAGLGQRLELVRWWMRRHIRRKPLAPWFEFPAGIRFRLVPWYSPAHLPASDATMATAWRTANVLASGGARCGRGLYLIQHFEDWSGTPREIEDTFRLPLRKIVISRWLQARMEALGERCDYLPNRLGLDEFGVDAPPARRDPKTILFLAHELEWKGTADMLAAIQALRRTIPDIRPRAFGIRTLPDFPGSIPFELAPHGRRLRDLYNEAAIFVSPSHSEGWGLPPCEAMACGCSVVLTDIDGHREFARDGVNALVVPPRDPAAIAAAVERLVRDDALRVRLATDGIGTLEPFRGDGSWRRFERIAKGEADV